MAKLLNHKQAQERVAKLIEQIDDFRYRYHVLDDPTVSDTVYDSLAQELAELEKQYPDLKQKNSPLSRIGGQALDKFVKVKHAVRQWSFNDAFSEQDLQDWQERISKILTKSLGHQPTIEYCCELKIDGLHVVLTYEDGQLKTAATRGDGLIGEDVTGNVKTIQSLPLMIKQTGTIIVEGEIWLSSEQLKKINQQRQKENLPLFANPRNAAAGAIRQLDPAIAADRKLDCFIYDWSGGDQTLPLTQTQELAELKKLKFKVNDHYKLCHNLDEVVTYWQKWQDKRDKQPYWIDGIVVKVNHRRYQEILGHVGKAPRWAMAFKFPAEQATTIVEDISVQVGRLGTLTPVAHLRPVKLAGTTVRRATLHNQDQIERLGLKIGDTVIVQKAGDIIPEVVSVLTKMRNGSEKSFALPQRCPICQSPTEKRSTLDGRGVAVFCTNKHCAAQQQARLKHFVAKKAFDIEGLGHKIIEQLLAEDLIKDAADIFDLTVDDLKPLERFADKSAQNLIASIQQAKNISLARFIFALGIEHVGEETAIALANHFGSLEKISHCSSQDFEQIPDIGPVVARSLAAFFTEAKNQRLLQRLLAAGIQISQGQKNTSQKLAGQTIVVTGVLPTLSREQAHELIRKNGGKVSSSVSAKTSYVVVGDKPGSKYEESKKLDLKILTEKDFLNLLK